MSQLSNNADSLLKTVLYSSLFHFPLTEEELFRYFSSDKRLNKKEFSDLLKKEKKYVNRKDGYYFLVGEEESVNIREKEKKSYREKMKIARRASRLLSYIPSILFIGISGSLAAGSAPQDADIDLFIITTPSTVWVTRFASILLLSFVNLRRKRGVKKAPNKVCLNSFMSIMTIDYFASANDVYTAHELAQLYPLLNRNKTYELFLHINKWYLRFLPHAQPRDTDAFMEYSSGIYGYLLQFFNPICTFFQMNYMKKHQTKEIVKKELILLHPYDYKEEILNQYRAKLMEYDLLTKG